MVEVQTIPEMNKKLNQLNEFFDSRTVQFKTTISQHEGRFTPQDYNEFSVLIQEIKVQAMEKIQSFFNDRLSQRSTTYQTQISGFKGDGDHVKSELQSFRISLNKATIDMKEEQHRKEQLMDFFSQKLRKNMIMKKCFKALRDYELERKAAKARDRRMDLIYQRNLMKKSFFPWRTLTYKDGYANSVRKQTQKDIMNIHVQYQGIIQILKNKINETDEMIRVKKAAKGQFAYALSKNLLKTISNLSMEVMNLNQMSLRDGEWPEEDTNKFMSEVDTVIKEKLMKVREYRKGLIGDDYQEEEGVEKKKKHISFA